jgi:hypothetical protein
MTIKKSYRFQIEHDDGSIDNVVIKGKTLTDARDAFMQEYPDLDWHDFGERLKEPRFSRSNSMFYNSARRGGQYLYQHKGRKKRGRKNYPTPKGRWLRVRRMSFTFTETISMPVRDFFQNWVGMLAQDTGLPVPEFEERAAKSVSLPIDMLKLSADGDLVLLGPSGKQFRFSLDFLNPPSLENDMQPQNDEATVPAIVFDSLGMLPEVRADYAACPPCVPVTAVDALGRALRDLRIGDRMFTQIPSDAELADLGDPTDPLTLALRCSSIGDTTGMMLNASLVPGVVSEMVARGLFAPSSTIKSDFVGTMAREMGVISQRTDHALFLDIEGYPDPTDNANKNEA